MTPKAGDTFIWHRVSVWRHGFAIMSRLAPRIATHLDPPPYILTSLIDAPNVSFGASSSSLRPGRRSSSRYGHVSISSRRDPPTVTLPKGADSSVVHAGSARRTRPSVRSNAALATMLEHDDPAFAAMRGGTILPQAVAS